MRGLNIIVPQGEAYQVHDKIHVMSLSSIIQGISI